MSDKKSDVKLEDIVSLAKRRGFIYQGSDIYGGLAGTWDYGPLGVSLKRNIMNLWWKMFVDGRDDMYGVDAAILMNQKVWQASGHVDTFVDPLTECLNCIPVSRHRVDKIIDKKHYETFLAEIDNGINQTAEALHKQGDTMSSTMDYLRAELVSMKDTTIYDKIKTDFEQYSKAVDSINNLNNQLIDAKKYIGTLAHYYLNEFVNCPICKAHKWTIPGYFNMMFETNYGLGFSRNVRNDQTDDEGRPAKILPSFGEEFRERVYGTESVSYLRPETAQGIFTNFKNVVDSYYPDVPFGIGQQGKAFRNEISPRDFVFRSREFEQMEIEYFVHPDKWEEAFEMWVDLCKQWFTALGLPAESVHELEVPAEDRAHYSKRTIDFEFDYPIGREELMGLAYRTDFDLGNIQRESRKNMEYRPKDGSPAFVPHVIEPSFGVERAIMAVLCSAYWNDTANERVVLKLPYDLAPIKVAVCPLAKNNEALVAKAREIYAKLKAELGAVLWIDSGNIGKNYRKMDEIGVPYVVTVDFDTLEGDTKNTVTVRHRDTTTQERVLSDDLLLTLRSVG